jgi:CheY-like chemotaxis protein
MDTEVTQVMGDCAPSGRILVVDDNPTVRALHRSLLANQYDVLTAVSGDEALAVCREHLPDLILLDIEMPGIDGTEVCRQLRTWTMLPIIFATSDETLEQHMRAYDAGGNDIIIKPVSREILLRKVALAIRQRRAETELAEQNQSLQRMAMSFLSTMGQNGALLNFMRASVGCRSHEDLARKLLATTADIGLQCSIMIRHDDGPTIITPRGDASPIEESIFEQSASMGRLFQFRRRLVVNYDRVSIIVANMPDETGDGEEAGRVRDNVAILAETAEALCENVDMRRESMARAEQLQIALGQATRAIEDLRCDHMRAMGDVRMLLQQLEDNVGVSLGWLGATLEQETRVKGGIDAIIGEILVILAEGGNFDLQFETVLSALRSEGSSDVELF